MDIKTMLRGFMPQELNQKRSTTSIKENQINESSKTKSVGKDAYVSGVQGKNSNIKSFDSYERTTEVGTAIETEKNSETDYFTHVIGYNDDGTEIVQTISKTMQTASEDTLHLSQEALDSLKDKTESLLDYAEKQLNYESNSKQDIFGSNTSEYDRNPEDTTFPTFDKVDKPSLDNQAEFDAWYSDFVKTNTDTKDAIENAINQIFKENGIEIPEGVALNLSVDPYDYTINVTFNLKETGEEVDFLTPKMEKTIEDALNKGDNGKNLYDHILYSNQNVENEYSGEAYDWELEVLKGEGAKKVFDLIKDYTGYDVRELVSEDGKLLTPDGEDVWELMTKKYEEVHGEEYNYGKQAKELEILKSTRYEDIANLGWESQLHSNMTIVYKDGELATYKPTK